MVKLSEIKVKWTQPSIASIRQFQSEIIKAARARKDVPDKRDISGGRAVKKDIEIDLNRFKHIKGLQMSPK